MTYFGGESSSLIHYNKNDTNRIQQISLKAHNEQTLISTYFASHSHSHVGMAMGIQWVGY